MTTNQAANLSSITGLNFETECSCPSFDSYEAKVGENFIIVSIERSDRLGVRYAANVVVFDADDQPVTTLLNTKHRFTLEGAINQAAAAIQEVK